MTPATRSTAPTAREVRDAAPAPIAAAALAALEQARQTGLAVTDDACRTGLAAIHWSGRFEKVRDDPLVILDIAHNTYSMEKLIEALLALAGTPRFTFVFGCMADKDVKGMLSIILPVARRVIFTQADLDRAANAADLLSTATAILAEKWQGETERPDLLVCPTIVEAVNDALERTASGEAICITGSLAVVGETRTLLVDKSESAVDDCGTVVENEKL